MTAPRRVLVADDDAALRGLLVRSLRRWGYEVVEVADGAQALEAIADGICDLARVDLAVVDVRMPYLGGLHVLAALRDLHPAVPLILISAFADPATHTLARRLGAAELLDKPFAIDDLRAALADAERRLVAHEIGVLVVDPDSACATALTEILRDDGFAARSAISTREAIAAVDAAAPDVVVIDIDHPRSAANELLGELRARAPELGVIVVTSREHDDRQVTGLQNAFRSSHARKPLDLRSLRASIVRLACA